MNRDELLTRLAMDLAAWPTTLETFPDFGMASGWQSLISAEFPVRLGLWSARHGTVEEQDWLAERERLINKPSWDDAPEWARYRCQQQTGAWCWYAYEPDLEWNKWAGGAINRSVPACDGYLPAGHDWRQTLEQRPVTQTADPVAEDDACREAERKLREAELTRHITPAELVNRQLVQRCDELQESNARLVDENQRLRRTIGELCA